MSKRSSGIALIIPLALLTAITGCPTPLPPPPEAVLSGTWELTGDVVAPEVSNFLLTFDQNGNITRMSYQFNNFTVTADDPSFIDSNATVSGSDVNIVATWLTVNNLVLDGTMNSALTQITGTASYRLVIGGVTVEVPAGAAQLAKR